MADDCAICGDPLFDSEGAITKEDGREKPAVQLPCKHMYHRECIQPIIKADGSAECPLCRTKFTQESMKQLDDKYSAKPVEKLPAPTPAIITMLKRSAQRFENDLEGFKEYSIAQLGKRYELTDAFLTKVFNEKTAGRRRRKTKRNLKRRLKNKRNTSKRI